MSDLDIEKLQAEFETAITQQQNAEALVKAAEKEQSHNRKLLDEQIKSGIQAQFLKEESALTNMSQKVDMNGNRITNLSHDVAKMGDEVKALRTELQKTATLDTLYSEREKKLQSYYDELKEQREEEYRKFCDEIAGKEEERKKLEKKRADEAVKKANDRIEKANKEAEEAEKRLAEAKGKLKRRTITWLIFLVVAIALGIYLGYQIVYQGWWSFGS